MQLVGSLHALLLLLWGKLLLWLLLAELLWLLLLLLHTLLGWHALTTTTLGHVLRCVHGRNGNGTVSHFGGGEIEVDTKVAQGLDDWLELFQSETVWYCYGSPIKIVVMFDVGKRYEVSLYVSRIELEKNLKSLMGEDEIYK